MSLWVKIQSLGEECQRHVASSLYSDVHQQKYKFPIEARFIFAEFIENAVCGGNGNIKSIAEGLDPANPNHEIHIFSFLLSFVAQLEEWLKNAQSPELFLTKLKMAEALQSLKENMQTDPLGAYEHIRNRIKAEMEYIAQTEVATSSGPADEYDPILENIQTIKSRIAHVTNVLEIIRQNEETFAINSNYRQQVDAILANPEPLQRVMGKHMSRYVMELQQCIAILDSLLPKNIQDHQNLMLQFEQTISKNISDISNLQNQEICKRIKIWKHEQQRMANGYPNKIHSISLEKLQRWCEGLAEMIWGTYEQLKKAESALENGPVPSDPVRLTFVRSQIQVVCQLLQKLLMDSLIVESQPTQVIRRGTRFLNPVVVTLLAGRLLNIHMNRSEMSACLISKQQAIALQEEGRPSQPIGEITNGCAMMSRDDSNRITFQFKNMSLIKTFKRPGPDKPRCGHNNESVLEEKYCMYFECVVTVGSLQFRIYTISLPVVVINHTTAQEDLALATIMWDNAFAEMDRLPFEVTTTVAWSGVAEILDAKFHEVTGRGLTKENLDFLAKKALRNREPLPKTITWEELCKTNLPGRNFTFWSWFHANLYRVIENNGLQTLWKEGLIMGFIERENAEHLILNCTLGTFLLRFADSVKGAITITLLYRTGKVISLDPIDEPQLKTKPIASLIKELKKLTFLYQSDRLVPKDEAFGKFYEIRAKKAKAPAGKRGYVPLVQVSTIQEVDTDSNYSGTTGTVPEPTVDNAGMFSGENSPDSEIIQSFHKSSHETISCDEDMYSIFPADITDSNYFDDVSDCMNIDIADILPSFSQDCSV